MKFNFAEACKSMGLKYLEAVARALCARATTLAGVDQ